MKLWCLLCFLLSCVWAASGVTSDLSDDDFYKILGLDLEATSDQIRIAFRKRSLQLHPDKNPKNPNAIKEFQRLERAYSILSNPAKKEIYDYEGIEALEEEEKGGGRKAHSVFDAFFGGGNSKPQGRNVLVEVPVTLEELYNGASKEAKIERNVICRKCRGTGAKDGKTILCKRCQGRGVIFVHEEMAPGFVAEMQKPCPKCQGKGKTAKSACTSCDGKRVAPEEKLFKIEIEPGMQSNQEIVFEKQSEQRPGMVPGNIVFRLRPSAHPLFRRSGNDLYHEMHISLEEALLGFQKQLKHLDEHKVFLTNSSVVQPFHEHVILQEGMPIHKSPSAHGELHVIYHVDFPKAISQKQREIIEKILS